MQDLAMYVDSTFGFDKAYARDMRAALWSFAIFLIEMKPWSR